MVPRQRWQAFGAQVVAEPLGVAGHFHLRAHVTAVEIAERLGARQALAQVAGLLHQPLDFLAQHCIRGVLGRRAPDDAPAIGFLGLAELLQPFPRPRRGNLLADAHGRGHAQYRVAAWHGEHGAELRAPVGTVAQGLDANRDAGADLRLAVVRPHRQRPGQLATEIHHGLTPLTADQTDQPQVHGTDLHTAAANDDVREMLLQDTQNALNAGVRPRQSQGVAHALGIGLLVDGDVR